MLRASVALIVGMSAAAVASAQQGRQPVTTFVGEERVNNITVDVQVRDAQGIPVRGLRRDDFRLSEAGKEQRLTNFMAVNGGEVEAAADSALVGQPAPRQVVIFFDLYLMTEPDKRRIVEGFKEQFGSGLPPGMTVAVVSFDGALRVHTPPTASREKLLEALKAVERQPATGLQRTITLAAFDVSDAPARESYSEYQMRRTQNEEYWVEMRQMVGRVENAFSATVQRYSSTPARKVVILASPGFPRAKNVPMYRDYDFFLDMPAEYRNNGLLGRAATLASELEYTLYTLDPSGNQMLEADASASSPPQFTDVANINFWRESDRKATLVQAARLTGGEALFTGDTGAALADVERLTASFYSLGYQPDHFGDGKAYTIAVEVVGHPDYTLTYRTRYVDRPFDERQAERSRAALLTGENANPLGIELVLDKPNAKFRFGAQRMRSYRIGAELRIPYARLVMIPRGPLAWGQVQVVVLAVDPKGNLSQLSHQKIPIEIAAEKLEEARQRGYFAYKFTLELEGGPTSLRIAVDDVLARTTSTVIADLKL